MDDAEVVAAFVVHLADEGHPGLTVDARPDLDNRDSFDIDAIAGPFAIEHTSIDTIENQRRDGRWFADVVTPLELIFRERFPFRLRLVFPHDGIARGQDWQALQVALYNWLDGHAGTLADGFHSVEAPGVPFTFRAGKDSHGTPAVLFSRFEPDDTSLPDRLRTQLDRKAAKLRPYQERGLATVLLVECDDIALMSPDRLLRALRRGYALQMPAGVQRLWYVDTSTGSPSGFFDFTDDLVAPDRGETV